MTKKKGISPAAVVGAAAVGVAVGAVAVALSNEDTREKIEDLASEAEAKVENAKAAVKDKLEE